MMAKRQVPIKTPTDWGAAGRNLGIFILGVLSVFSLYQQNHVSSTVERIKHQTDGNATAAKLAIAISASSLAKATNSDQDLKTAKEAWEAYEAQRKIQETAESP